MKVVVVTLHNRKKKKKVERKHKHLFEVARALKLEANIHPMF